MSGGPPMVGRAAEASSLAEVISGAGRLRHAFVVGEAGVGKSRLLEVACDSAREAGVMVLWGACLPLTECLPLMPIVDVIRAAASVQDGANLEATLAGRRGYVRESVERLLSAVTPARGDERDASAGLRQQTFEAVRQLLEALAEQARFAVVIEDLHWADISTVDLLEYLLAPQHAFGMPVVVTYRDHPAVEGGSPADRLLGQAIRRGDALRIDLAPLSREQMAEQVAALTDRSGEPGFLDAIYERSQGNPFFTEQLVAHLIGPDEGGETTTVPPLLAELLLSRVAELDSPARDVLQGLAVAQRPLDASDLARVCTLSAAEVQEAITRLRRRGLLRPRTDGYELRHHLLAYAVEQDLFSVRRRELHGAVGTLIAEWPDDRFAAEAAEHFERAGDTESELSARMRAGAYAQQAFAWADAERHWRRALACYGPIIPRPDDQRTAWTIYAGLHAALLADARVDDALQFAEDAYERLLDHSQGLERAELCRRLGKLRGRSSSASEMPLLESALSACSGLPPSGVELMTLAGKESALRHAGRIAEARSMLDRMSTVAAAIGDYDAQVEITGLRAWHAMYVGADKESYALVRRLLTTGMDARGWRTPTFAGLAATSVLVKLGRLDEVAAGGLRPLEISEERGLSDHLTTWLLRFDMADALTELGRTAEANALLDRVATSPLTHTTFMGFVASAHLATLNGNLDAADAAWQALDRITISSINFRTEYQQRRAEFELWRQRPQAAFDGGLTALAAAQDNDESAFSGPLLVLVLRVVAEQAITARARRDHEALVGAHARADQLITLHESQHVDPLVRGPARPAGDALRATWDAELARLNDQDSASAWSAAASAWSVHDRPHRVAYALLRQAEVHLADRRQYAAAREVLTRAAGLSRTHAPLLRSIVDLAARARVDLAALHDEAASDALPIAGNRSGKQFDLTDRERAVLALITRGCSNAEIGANLFISPKTASVHVTNILRKLDVSTRAAAAALAERAGLVDR